MVHKKKLVKKTKKLLKKKKTKFKSNIQKTKALRKMKIKDVKFSSFLNKGSDASSNIIDYNYQHQSNILDFLHKLHKQGAINDVCFFSKPTDATLEIDILKKKVFPMYVTHKNFVKKLRRCQKHRFIPLSVRALLPIKKKEIESHANVIIIDSALRKIEIFEPHGYKSKYSNTYESVSKYHNKIDLLVSYFNKILPEYRLINVVNYIKDRGFQSKYDARSGYCVTWSTLYAHYRIINPTVKVSKLLSYLKKKINVNLLLRYARFIEDKLKNKI